MTGLPDYPWENPGDDLDDLDLSAVISSHTARTDAAQAAGVKAFAEGIPVTAAPNQDYEHWRAGWFTARNHKLSWFEKYLKARTLFDQQYTPQYMRNQLPEIQARRQKIMDRAVEFYPDIPAAYDKHKAWKAGK